MDMASTTGQHHRRPGLASTFALAGSLAAGLVRSRSVGARVPRTHPFGWGRSCDGCDLTGEWRAFTNGGQYCDDCAAYVAEVTDARPRLR